MQNQIEGNRLRWFRHIKRMEEHRIPKRLLEIKMTTKRPRGRPQTQWLDQVKTDIERIGRSWGKVKEMQEWINRGSWRLLCRSRYVRVETT
jgi:hypothetical protein